MSSQTGFFETLQAKNAGQGQQTIAPTTNKAVNGQVCEAISTNLRTPKVQSQFPILLKIAPPNPVNFKQSKRYIKQYMKQAKSAQRATNRASRRSKRTMRGGRRKTGKLRSRG